MKFTVASVSLLLAGLATAYPANGNTNSGASSKSNSTSSSTNSGSSNPDQPAIQDGSNDTNPPSQVDQQTALLMSTAIDAWMRDTGVVSNFLNIGGSIQDSTTFQNQAQIAHSAEVDELTHKAVLDQFMPNNKNVQQANATLSNGAFQLVVDQLDTMARQGPSQNALITSINNDRCVNVLPNIDTYMREASLTIGNGQGIPQSVRPAACANVVAGQNGAAQVGAPPAGYVNGKLQNGTSNTNPNIAATPADDDQPEINLAGTQSSNSGSSTNSGANSQASSGTSSSASGKTNSQANSNSNGKANN